VAKVKASKAATTPTLPAVGGSDIPAQGPTTFLSAFTVSQTNFRCTSTEAQVQASGAPSVTDAAGNTYYVGTAQVTGDNQNPVIVSFDSTGTQRYCSETAYENDGPDADAKSIIINRNTGRIFVGFTIDGGSTTAFDGFLSPGAWFPSFGVAGTGGAVSVIAEINPTTGGVVPNPNGTYIRAETNGGQTNTILVREMSFTNDGNLLIRAASRFSPFLADGVTRYDPLTQCATVGSDFAWSAAFDPNDFTRPLSTQCSWP
jgi:hypothetical protein